MVFELLRRYQLRMNPLKCAFAVTSGKFIGFIVQHRGTEIDQAKVDAILKMHEPRDIHELKSVQGNPYSWKAADTIHFSTKKAIKGQALADFLADHPIPGDWDLTDELPNEDAMVIEVQPLWKMYFDGVAHHGGAGAGVVFVTSQGEVLPYSFMLTQLCSNNVAEYQALILGLEMAVEMKRLQLQVFGDSQLVHVPRKENKKADALAALASSLTCPIKRKLLSSKNG
uniref:Uncharacterized protein LOC104239253 n=1 Tax=Nicotiana sylvestris TaxID=4096 RepID=A0A1U7XJA8_NICSY|nr:PREDICTED: uncharacterized protein LOC104239253 [Nicotiana sylvestris]